MKFFFPLFRKCTASNTFVTLLFLIVFIGDIVDILHSANPDEDILLLAPPPKKPKLEQHEVLTQAIQQGELVLQNIFSDTLCHLIVNRHRVNLCYSVLGDRT